MKNKKRFRSFTMILAMGMIITILFFILVIIFSSFVLYLNDVEFRNVIDHFGKSNYRKIPLWLLLAALAFLTSLMSWFVARIQLKPFNKFKDGINKLAKGDFETRMHMGKNVPYEFDELADSFNLLAVELSGIEMLRKDFINNFSHEFKTPITSIRGFAKILQRETLTEEEKQDYLKIIVSESERLSRLSQNILTLCKVDNQNMDWNKEVFSPAEQIRLIILMLENEWEKKNLSFDIELKEFDFKGNSEFLNNVWLNLIDNAIKFSINNTDILVRLEENEKEICFTVFDFGVEIDEEKQSKIFDKFYQADTSHAVQGNGIGLSIVKSVVKMHNGKISVSSSSGRGTTFTVKLPKII